MKLGRRAYVTVYEVDRRGTLQWAGESGCSVTSWPSINAVYFQCIVVSGMLRSTPVLVNYAYLCSEFIMKKKTT